jgi:hypothetical protein
MSERLTCWLHYLATVALLSTVIWSLAGFITIYWGPHQLWDHGDELGRGVFFSANLFSFFSIVFYLLGIAGVWTGFVHEHLLCIAIAEGLFWLFDKIVIKRIKQLQDSWAAIEADMSKRGPGSDDERKPDPGERLWATELRDRLSAWKDYVDGPTTLAFLMLYVGGRYLEHVNKTLLNPMEVELFSAGAVFFALMTANLAFYAANKPIDGLITEPDRNQHHGEREAPSAA